MRWATNVALWVLDRLREREASQVRSAERRPLWKACADDAEEELREAGRMENGPLGGYVRAGGTRGVGVPGNTQASRC